MWISHYMAEQEEDNGYDARMTFTEHLGELRTRIIRASIVVVIAIVGAYIAGAHLIEAIMWPITGRLAHEEAGGPVVRMMYTNPLNPLLVRLRVAAYGGLLIGSPFVVHQICAFVFPGLRKSEKRAIQIMLTGGSMLAIAGVLVAYFGVLPVVVPYLMRNFLPPGYELSLRPDETIPIIIKAILGFAIAFQFPMAVLVLVHMDLLSPQTLKQYRKLAWVVMAAGSAMLTPPDPFSMLVMLLPLGLLYEASILLSYLVVRRKKKPADAAP